MALRRLELQNSQIKELVNLYRHGMPDEDVATYFGVHVKVMRRWMHKRENFEIVQEIERAKVIAKVSMRQALFSKGVGSRYQEGRPKVIKIKDGREVIEDQGQPAVAAIPGDLQAQKFWLMNCDDSKKWADTKSTQLSGPNGEPLQVRFERMSNGQLTDYILSAIKDGTLPADGLKAITQKPKREQLPLRKEQEIQDIEPVESQGEEPTTTEQ